MHAKYEVSISYGSKDIAKVKVDNRQTDKQTDRQDKNNMPPIIRYGGIRIWSNLDLLHPEINCYYHANRPNSNRLSHAAAEYGLVKYKTDTEPNVDSQLSQYKPNWTLPYITEFYFH